MNDEDYNDDEILGDYLIETDDDLTLIMMPKLDIDLDSVDETYYKTFKKCKTKEQFKNVLRKYRSYISTVALLQSDIAYLQDRAKELEYNIHMLQNE